MKPTTLLLALLLAGCAGQTPQEEPLTEAQRCGQFGFAVGELLQLRGQIVHERLLIGMKLAGAPDAAMYAAQENAKAPEISAHLAQRHGPALDDIFSRLHGAAGCPLEEG